MNSHFIKLFSLKDISIFFLLLLSFFPIGLKTFAFYLINFLLLFFAGFYYKSLNLKSLYFICFFYVFLFIKTFCFDRVETYDSIFFSQINHFLQLPILIYLWFEIIKRKGETVIKTLKNNYIYVYIILLCSIFYNIYTYGKSFNDFNIFYILILISFYINFRKKDLLFFILFLITPILFNFERLSFILILFFILLDRIIFNQVLRSYLYKFLIISILFSSIFILLFYSNSMLGFIYNFDGNIALRIEMIHSAYNLLSSDISQFFFGVPFGEFYRSPNYLSVVNVPHLSDPYLLSTVPNHNSIFDIFYRFGLFGFIFIIFFLKKILFSSYVSKSKKNNIFFLFFLFVFGISMNPYLEDQDNLIFISFIISSILFLHKRYVLQK